MKLLHTSVSLLFAFLPLLTTTPLRAQKSLERDISLSQNLLPFAELIVPVQIQDEGFRGRKLDVIYDFPNKKDSITGMIDSLSEWHLSYVYCWAQWGMMLQNQAYGQHIAYGLADTAIVLSGTDLFEAFSADSTFTLSPKVHTAFNSPDQHEGEWFMTQWGNILLVKLVRNLSPADPENIPSPDYFYHKEEYWYFFRQI